ncbi:MAG: dihydrofolate reductase [Sphingobacteriales bacterium]|nr:MAG: dihydrofolate reductase [Sphingobacteriales bacterium]
MTISAIVALAEDNAIGKDNQLPWHLPDDLKFFKRTTMGKPVLMGRKTFESLGRPLPGRLNLVVSGQKELNLPDGVLLFNTLEDGIERLEAEDSEEVFIIGGGTIFSETMNTIDRLYITRVHTTVPGATAFFPEVDHTHWKLVWEEFHPADEKHAYSFTFQQLERINL